MANVTFNTAGSLETTIAAGDIVPFWKTSAGGVGRITKANFMGGVLTGGGTINTGGFTMTIPASGTAALTGSANVFATQQTINPSATNVHGLQIGMPASTTFYAIEVLHNSAEAIRLTASATDRSLIFPSFANGAGSGPYVYVGRNLDGLSPAAGHMAIVNKNGTDCYFWFDAGSVMRVSSVQPTNATDTGGTIIGTQTSWHALKENISRALDTDRMLDAVMNLRLYDFQMRGNAKRHTGIVITEEDRREDAWFAMELGEGQTPSLNERNLFGYMAGAIQELQRQIDELRGQSKAQ